MPLATVKRQSAELLQDLGGTAAALDVVLANFKPAAIHREFIWDLAGAAGIIDAHAALVRDPDLQTLVRRLHANYLEHAQPLLAALLCATSVQADEGQWQPYQLPQLKSELKRVGIAIPAEKLADLSKHPMSAIVSLGGCSASFVSDAGLVVTNHHCAYGAIQRNSTPEHNYIANGFLAKTRAAELPGGPNTLVYVTDKVENVTNRVLKDVTPSMSGKQRSEAVERAIKSLIAECESDKIYRCSVPAFHRFAPLSIAERSASSRARSSAGVSSVTT